MPRQVLLPIERLLKEFPEQFGVLNSEPDFAVILAASSFLNACLGSILERKLTSIVVIDGEWRFSSSCSSSVQKQISLI